MRRSKRRKETLCAPEIESIRVIEPVKMELPKPKEPERLWFLNVPRDLEITKTSEHKLSSGAIKVSVYFSGEIRYKIVFNVYDPVKYQLSRIWKDTEKSSEVRFECANNSVSFLIWEREE